MFQSKLSSLNWSVRNRHEGSNYFINGQKKIAEKKQLKKIEMKRRISCGQPLFYLFWKNHSCLVERNKSWSHDFITVTSNQLKKKAKNRTALQNSRSTKRKTAAVNVDAIGIHWMKKSNEPLHYSNKNIRKKKPTTTKAIRDNNVERKKERATNSNGNSFSRDFFKSIHQNVVLAFCHFSIWYASAHVKYHNIQNIPNSKRCSGTVRANQQESRFKRTINCYIYQFI